MPLRQLLPSRVKVALGSASNDARHFVRALSETRFKGARARSGASIPLQVPLAPKRVVLPTPGRTVAKGGVVEFATSGVTLQLGPDETILEAGLRNGVDLLFSCTLGGCGACMLQIREGEVDYDDPDANCLTDEEVQEGICLACVGRPRGHVVLEA